MKWTFPFKMDNCCKQRFIYKSLEIEYVGEKVACCLTQSSEHA